MIVKIYFYNHLLPISHTRLIKDDSMNRLKLETMLKSFLEEDIGDGDITAEAIFTNDEQGSGDFLMKSDGVLAGTDIIEVAYQLLDPRIQVTLHYRDGEKVATGTKIATVQGPIQAILTGERVILNLLQRLSGIATLTKQCVD